MGVFDRFRKKKDTAESSGFRRETVEMEGERALDRPTVSGHPNELQAKKTGMRFQNKFTAPPKNDSIPAPRRLERVRVKLAERRLKGYKQRQDRQRLAEVRVYGHELSEKERGEYQKTVKQQEKERQERMKRAFGSFGATPASAPRRRRARYYRSYRAPAPARPQSLLGDLGATGEFLGVGGGCQPPRKRISKGIGGDLSLGGFI